MAGGARPVHARRGKTRVLDLQKSVFAGETEKPTWIIIRNYLHKTLEQKFMINRIKERVGQVLTVRAR
jgi:hypothetical protein